MQWMYSLFEQDFSVSSFHYEIDSVETKAIFFGRSLRDTYWQPQSAVSMIKMHMSVWWAVRVVKKCCFSWFFSRMNLKVSEISFEKNSSSSFMRSNGAFRFLWTLLDVFELGIRQISVLVNFPLWLSWVVFSDRVSMLRNLCVSEIRSAWTAFLSCIEIHHKICCTMIEN